MSAGLCGDELADVGWLLLRLFKYQLLAEETLSRMCWYGYYLFQLALPVALLYLAELLDRPEGERRLLRPLWPPLVCYGLSVLLVMTNDLHQLVSVLTPMEIGPGSIATGWAIACHRSLPPVFGVGHRKAFLQEPEEYLLGQQTISAVVLWGTVCLSRCLYLPGASGMGK